MVFSTTALALAACSPAAEMGGGDLDSSSMSIVAGDSQYGSINNQFSVPLTVQVVASSGRSNIPIYFSLTSDSVPMTLSKNLVNTDDDGRATIHVTSQGISGTGKIEARVGNSTKDIRVVFTLFVNGEATQWRATLAASTPAPVTAGTTFKLHVEALNSLGNVDPYFNGSKVLNFSSNATNAPAGTAPILPADGLYSFTNGVIDADLDVKFFNRSANAGDKFYITVSGSSLTSHSTTPFNVNPSTASEVRITSASTCPSPAINNTNYVTNITENLYSFYFDTYGNCIDGGASGNWTKTFTNPQAAFISGTTGVNTVQFQGYIAAATGTVSFTDGTLSDSTGTITIGNGAAAYFLVTGINTDNNFTVAANANATVRLEARDAFSNVAQNYTGTKTLTWSSTATSLVPMTALGLATANPVIPTSGNYNFNQGVMTTTATINLKKSSETPTLTVYDGASCGASLCATSANITVTALTRNKVLVRKAAGGVGGDANTFDATALTPTADSSYPIYCAAYDSIGNYLNDATDASWAVSGVITTGDLSPGITNQSNITYAARVAGTGTITCSVNAGAITSSTGTFTVVPGAPKSFALDGGAGNGNAFTITAGNTWPLTVRLYDADNNHCTNYTNATLSTLVSYIGTTALNPPVPSGVTPLHTAASIDGTVTNSKTVTLNVASGVGTITNNRLINANVAEKPKIQISDPAAVISTAQSGIITVSNNTLYAMAIRNAASNAGSVINSSTTTRTDLVLPLYAAGFDNSGNYIGDQTVNWNNTAPAGNCTSADLSGNPGPITNTVSVNFQPVATGVCSITAYHAGTTVSKATGNITLGNGTAHHLRVSLLSGTTVTAGSAFVVKVRAEDVSNNLVTNYTPSGSYTFTTTSGNSPEGTAPAGFTITSADWAGGQAFVATPTVYLAGTFTMTVTEVGGSGTTGTSVTMTANPNTLHHYAVTATGGSTVADRTTAFTATVQARDQWGNATTTGIGANINLTMVWQADEALVAPIGNGTALSLAGASSKTFTGLTYGVSHQVKIVATDTNSVTTPTPLQQTLTFTPAAGGIQDYLISSFSTTTPTAGTPFTATITARDQMGNTITGLDATLGGYTFAVTSTAATSPYSNAPVHFSNTRTFTNGVSATFPLTFHKTETIAGANITLNDGNGKTGNATGNSIVVAAAALNTYDIQTSSGTTNADATATFQAQITARDAYGNIRPGDANITLVPNQVTGGTAGTLGGTTTSIDMTSGSNTINNLTYNVAGTMRLNVSGGTVTAAAAHSTLYTFTAVAGSLHHYQLSFSSPQTVNTGFAITVTAKDAANNTITAIDATLNARTFTWGGFANSPEGTAPVVPTAAGSFTFVNGVSTTVTAVQLYMATTIASGALTLTDSAGKSGASGSALVVNAGPAHHITFTGANSGTADNTTNYSLTVNSLDAYGNPKASGVAGDQTLTLIVNRVSGLANTGTLSGTTTVDLRNNSSVTVNVRYRISHTTRFNFAVAPSHSNGINYALSTATVTWAIANTTVASYTLEPSGTTVVAGANTNFLLKAYDAASNLITGEDAHLNGHSFTFNFLNTSCDAPNTTVTAASTQPAAGTLTFSGGISTLVYRFYNVANGVAAGVVRASDTTAGLANFSNTATMTVTSAAGNYFDSTGGATGFPAQANNTVQTGKSVVITLKDTYGNPTMDAAASAATITFQRVSGVTNTGTFTLATSAGGAQVSVGAVTLDFSTSTTRTLYDFKYNVAHVIDIRATAGAITQTNARAVDMTFQATTATVASYTLTFASGTAVAGASTNMTLTAKDAANNTITGYDAVLGTINLTFTASSNNDAPNATQTAAANDPADGTKTFTAGVATLPFKFYAVRTVALSEVTINDTTNTLSVNNTNTINITPATATTLSMTGLSGGSAGTVQTATVTAKDTYNNTATGYVGTVTFTSSDAQIVKPANYTFLAGDNGVKAFTNGFTLKTVGTQSVTATDTVTGTITGSQTGLVITPAAATSLTVAGLTGAVAGTAQTVTVTAKDNFNNTVTGYTGTITFTSSDGQIVKPADYTFLAGDNGVKVFTNGITLKTVGAQSVTATDTVTGTINGSQTGLTITPAAAATITMTGLAGGVAGTAQTATVTARDAYNNTATGYTGTVTFTSTDGQIVKPANYTFLAGDNGVKAFTNGITLKTVGSQSVTVTDTGNGALTSTQATLAITPAAAATIAMTGLAGSVAGTAQTATVTAYDAYSNTATGYTGTVTFTSTDGQIVKPANYTFLAGDNGVKVFTNGITLKTVGSQSVTVTDTGNGALTSTQATLAITPAAAATITMTGLTGGVAGTAQTATVTAHDAYNNVATGYTGTVTFTSTDGQIVKPANYTFLAGDNGVKAFTNGITLKTVGSQSVTVTDTGNGALTSTQGTLAITHAAAATITMTGLVGGVAGTAQTATVTAHDAYNNVATGYTGTVTFTSTDGQIVKPANYTFLAGDNGVKAFTNGITLKTVGSQSVTVTDTGNGALTSTQGTLAITPAAATTLAVTGLAGGVAGTAQTVTVTAKDAYNNTATGYTGIVTFTSSDAQVVKPADYTFLAGDNGVKVFTNGITLKTVGSQSVTVTDTVTGTINGSQTGLTITPAAAATITMTGLTGGVAGTAQTATVTARDAYNNTATGYTGTVTFTSTDGQIVKPADYTFLAGDNGVKAFTNGITLKTVGSQSVTVTDTGNGALTNTQAALTITPAAASTLAVTGLAGGVAGTAQTVTVTAKDTYNNTATGYTGTVTFTSTDGQIVKPANYTFLAGDNGVKAFTNGITLKTVGSQSVTVTDTVTGTINGSQTGLTITPAAAATITMTGLTGGVAGTAQTATVTARDAYNNTATGYTGTVTFTSSDGQIVKPADYTFLAGDNGVKVFTNGITLKTVGSQSVTVTDTGNGALTSTQGTLAITHAAAATITMTGLVGGVAGTAQTATVTAHDAYNNVATGYTGTVTFTSTDGQIVKPANYTFLAGDNGVKAFTNGITLKTVGSQSVTVTDTGNGALTSTQAALTITPAAATTLAVTGLAGGVAGTAQTVTVTAKDAYNNTATGYTGTVTFTSTDAQIVKPADYTFLAGDNGVKVFTNGITLKTVGSQSVTVTDTVTGTINGSQTGLTITPAAAATITMTGLTGGVAGTAQTATVTAKDAYNNTATGYTGTVTFTSSDGQIVKPADYTFLAGDNGVKVFTNGITLKTVGTQSVTVTDTGNGALTSTQGTLAITPAAATTLAVTGLAGGTAGTAQTATVTAKDAYNNTATGYTGTVTFTSTDGQIVKPANYTFLAGDNGVKAFTNGITLKTAGTQSVTVTDTVTGTITGAQTGLAITAAAADHMVYTAGNGQSAVVNNAVSTAPRVRIVDQFGNGIAGYSVSFTVTDALAQSGSVGTASATTDASGYATSTYTLGKTAGTNTMRAEASGLAGTPVLYDFTETGTTDVAQNLNYATQPVAGQTINTNFATQPVIQIRDQWNNILTGDSSSSVSLSAFTDAGCTAAGAGSLTGNTATASSGVATFAGLKYSAAEAIYIKATVGAVTKCSNMTTVYGTLAIDNALGSAVNAGSTHTFEVSGGVPAIGITLSANNSLGSLGAAFTGGACPAGKVCATYTAGKNGGGSVDTVTASDTAGHSTPTNITVNGAVFSNTGDSVGFGSTASDLTRNFVIANSGNATSGAITTLLTPDAAPNWTLTTDNCNTVDVAAASNCGISVTFNAASATLASGNYTATLKVEGTSGTVTLNLTATVP